MDMPRTLTTLLVLVAASVPLPATSGDLAENKRIDLGYIDKPPAVVAIPVDISPLPKSRYQLRFIGYRWRSPHDNSALAVTPPALGTGFTEAHPLHLDFSFNPRPGEFNEQLVLIAQWVEGGSAPDPSDRIDADVEVNFHAFVDCLSENSNCKPKGPICTVDPNTDPALVFPVDGPEFISSVTSGISPIVRAQNGGFKNYKVPISTLWAAAGLADAFDPVALPDIDFVRYSSADNMASFNWTNSAPTSVSSKPGLPYSARFDLPNQLKGNALIGAGYVEFHFANAAFSPSFFLSNIAPFPGFPPNTTLYKNNVTCLGASITATTIKTPMNRPGFAGGSNS
jgi:hypothetical protein